MLFNIVKGWLFSPVRMALKLAFWGFIIAFVLITIFLLTFNVNNFKPEIEKFAANALDMPVEIKGDVKLGLENLRPSIILNDVMAGKKGKTTVAVAKRLEITLPFQRPDNDNPFSIFANLDNIVIDGKPLGDYDLPVKVSKRGFEIKGASGARGKGKLLADVSLLDSKFHLSAKADSLDYEELQSGVEDGEFRADILLDARGPDYVSDLSGHVTLIGGEGRIEGDSIGFWAGDLLVKVLTGRKDETRLECAVASFDVQKGIARSRAIIIETQDVVVFGEGRINIAEGYVDMLFTPKPKNPSLVSLATPLRVRGPFGQVKTSPDPEATLKKFGGMLLGVINPAAALLPLMSSGAGNNRCLQYIGKK